MLPETWVCMYVCIHICKWVAVKSLGTKAFSLRDANLKEKISTTFDF